MQYLITFLEGMITFISPCVLPLLPVYILYFAGGEEQGKKSVKNALGFVLGFTLLFVALGGFAGTLGSLFTRHQTAVNLITGAVVILFGLHYAGILQIGLLNRTIKPGSAVKPARFWSAVLFGAIFAIGWSPCTGAFLGSAMMLAASQSGWVQGMLLLFTYSLGLGVPFVLCAVLIDRLKGAFDWIKQHYRVINLICGIFLIAVGVLMMTGLFSRLMAALA